MSLSFVAIACGQSTDWVDTIHGKWKCDVEKTVKLLEESDMSSERLELVREYLPTLTLELTSEGAMNMAMGSGETRQERTATYQTVETDKEKKTIAIEVHMENEDSAKGGKVTILDENTIKLVTDDASVPLILVRVREEEGSSSKDD